MNLNKGEEEVGPGLVMTDREWAARVLQELAEDCHDGAAPTVSVFDVGRALGRALANAGDEGKYSDLLLGLIRYERVKKTMGA